MLLLPLSITLIPPTPTVFPQSTYVFDGQFSISHGFRPQEHASFGLWTFSGLRRMFCLLTPEDSHRGGEENVSGVPVVSEEQELETIFSFQGP